MMCTNTRDRDQQCHCHIQKGGAEESDKEVENGMGIVEGGRTHLAGEHYPGLRERSAYYS